jgi:hypothetical protein
VSSGFANQGYFAFDVSTSKGKALLSVLLSAYLAGKGVGVQGAGSCTNAGAVTLETVSKVTLGASGA